MKVVHIFPCIFQWKRQFSLKKEKNFNFYFLAVDLMLTKSRSARILYEYISGRRKHNEREQ